MVRRASDLVGKPIISSQTGNRLASVGDVVLDSEGRRVAALLIDGGLFGGERRAILWPAVRAVGDTVVVEGEAPLLDVRDDMNLTDLLKLDRRLSGTAIISEQTGERLGTVNEVYIDDAGYVVGFEVKTGLLSGNAGMISATDVRTVGRDAIITTATQLHAFDNEQMRPYVDPDADESLLGSTATTVDPASRRPMGANVEHTRDVDRDPADNVELERDRVEPDQTRQRGAADPAYGTGAGMAPAGPAATGSELPAAAERSYSPGLGAGVEPPSPLDLERDGSRSLDVDPGYGRNRGHERPSDLVDLDLGPNAGLDSDQERGTGIDPIDDRGPRL